MAVDDTAKYFFWEGGQAYGFGIMTSHLTIDFKQKTTVFQNIGGGGEK